MCPNHLTTYTAYLVPGAIVVGGLSLLRTAILGKFHVEHGLLDRFDSEDMEKIEGDK